MQIMCHITLQTGDWITMRSIICYSSITLVYDPYKLNCFHFKGNCGHICHVKRQLDSSVCEWQALSRAPKIKQLPRQLIMSKAMGINVLTQDFTRCRWLIMISKYKILYYLSKAIISCDINLIEWQCHNKSLHFANMSLQSIIEVCCMSTCKTQHWVSVEEVADYVTWSGGNITEAIRVPKMPV